jgi:hypothetical protein
MVSVGELEVADRPCGTDGGVVSVCTCGVTVNEDDSL